jgi:hypothetical protein
MIEDRSKHVHFGSAWPSRTRLCLYEQNVNHIGKLLGFKMVDEVDYFVPCSHAFEFFPLRILQYMGIPPAQALRYPFSGPKMFINLGTQL